MKVSEGRLKALCSLLILVGLAYALRSVETMRLSTTYPAPSGVYKKIITTGQTILAQKTGSVVIGKVDSPTRKLEVEGGASFGGNVNMLDTNKVTNAADPTDPQDYATKKYVDEKALSSRPRLPAPFYGCGCEIKYRRFGNDRTLTISAWSPTSLERQECGCGSPGHCSQEWHCWQGLGGSPWGAGDAPIPGVQSEILPDLCWCTTKAGKKCGYRRGGITGEKCLLLNRCTVVFEGEAAYTGRHVFRLGSDAEVDAVTGSLTCVKSDLFFYPFPQ